ncbi:hypothetical protein H2201_008501 [Coniosporium apollinis]|uniref:DAZ-associated protein 2 n=1 Tax=Coniosporium apollinis TaxID=61459 RepID=A0ABQ9NG07_9PEZI|nr:hypothetical protein H2201_008501 [Coniosporium apollinis]
MCFRHPLNRASKTIPIQSPLLMSNNNWRPPGYTPTAPPWGIPPPFYAPPGQIWTAGAYSATRPPDPPPGIDDLQWPRRGQSLYHASFNTVLSPIPYQPMGPGPGNPNIAAAGAAQGQPGGGYTHFSYPGPQYAVQQPAAQAPGGGAVVGAGAGVQPGAAVVGAPRSVQGTGQWVGQPPQLQWVGQYPPGRPAPGQAYGHPGSWPPR